ncbi:hypothetical protein [Brevibacillus fulvus]|uniref:DNA-binding GntR family transcriptional regulator n=1 Tax=Brevibacillus fulvus TaxID=1125967 RepID=A0A939BSY0_9BACL|nr:hypothetical protein [Brevibacillus fulvus]MBM7588949.1 DNA-binding GntR family transcriptional regulator [Brevibacillus fulvus]
MDKNLLFERVKTAIHSSTKTPKYMAVSTVRLASVFDVSPAEIEQGLNELVQEGKLQRGTAEQRPSVTVYMLPA